MNNLQQTSQNTPEELINSRMEMQRRQAKRIYDYSNQISSLKEDIEIIYKTIKRVSAPEAVEKFNLQLEKRKKKKKTKHEDQDS